jgi:hypothetical protein
MHATVLVNLPVGYDKFFEFSLARLGDPSASREPEANAKIVPYNLSSINASTIPRDGISMC